MKNDKQIAFTELRSQSSSAKFVFTVQCQNNFPECLKPRFVFLGYFIHEQICNPNRDYDFKY